MKRKTWRETRLANPKPQITEEKPPYRPWGRYVCDWRLNELHLFDTIKEARTFARSWGRNCNIGWLAPICERGVNRKPTTFEARKQASFRANCHDHRKPTAVLIAE